MNKSIVFAFLFLISVDIAAQNSGNQIVGIWKTGGNEPAKIEIYKSGNKYFGKLVRLTNPLDNGRPKLDKNNPDKIKQQQPIIGLVMLKDFEFDGKDEWKNGSIYDPGGGKTYKSYMSLKDNNTLKVRGYIGVSLIGKTDVWTRSSL